MSQSATQLRDLSREVSQALELALVALAPPPMIESTASAAALLDALKELPLDERKRLHS
jgi:hypothetical protein